MDNTKEASEGKTPKKTLVEYYRKQAAREQEARKIYAETTGLDNLKYGRTALSEAQRQKVLKTIEKGGRITSDGTLQLTASLIEGGMSGEGSSGQVDFSNINREERCYMLADRMFERFRQGDKNSSKAFKEDIRGFMLKHPMNEIEYDEYFMPRLKEIASNSSAFDKISDMARRRYVGEGE